MAQASSEEDGICVLIAEDDDEIRELIIGQFSREPYRLKAAKTISSVKAELSQNHIDILILDLNFLDGDGLELCKDLRSQGFSGAIIMVTARDAFIDRVLGLELGANDYLAKPFEPRELLLRVRNLAKTLQNTPPPAAPMHGLPLSGHGGLICINVAFLTHDDRLVMLSSAEYRLLIRFVESADKVLSREDLVADRKKVSAADRSIDLQVSRLRQKLAIESGGQNAILTVRNEGYVMPGPVSFV